MTAQTHDTNIIEAQLGGPISLHLERELRAKMSGNRFVVWLDNDGLYSAFVDRLAHLAQTGVLPYAVGAFRGSHLEMMLALDAERNGQRPTLLHLPGYTEETIRKTPFYGPYCIGIRFRRTLATAIRDAGAGHVPPDELEKTGLHSLEEADLWLADRIRHAEHTRSENLRTMTGEGLLHDLLAGGVITAEAADEEIMGLLMRQFGLPSNWQEHLLTERAHTAESRLFLMASWALAVEYVHDLTRPHRSPILAPAKQLPKTVVSRCFATAAKLRDKYPHLYRRIADEMEAALPEEVEGASANDLGKIDTFRFEEVVVLREALANLAIGKWDTPKRWAQARLHPEAGRASFWVQQEVETRVPAWQLVESASALGEALDAAGAHLDAETLDNAMQVYMQRGAAVDRAHRHLEQRLRSALNAQLPEFSALRMQMDALRTRWRNWSDTWSQDTARLYRTVGFLPSPSLRQRNLFEEVVLPRTEQKGAVVLFMVDALRYEMGEALAQALQVKPGSSSQIKLEARLAELPTVTEVGMNVLAPVTRNGKLIPALSPEFDQIIGFTVGEYRVNSPGTRLRAMAERVGGSDVPMWALEDLLKTDGETLKRAIKNVRLAVVHSQEIDLAGEIGLGVMVFDEILSQLRGAIERLRDAGVRRIVVTSDHGFLLRDELAPRALAHGRRADAKRRHAMSVTDVRHPNEVRASFANLGYLGHEGYIHFPESNAVFDTSVRSGPFVHGGPSLPERIIPVLIWEGSSRTSADSRRFELSVRLGRDVEDMQRVFLRLLPKEQPELELGGPKEVEIRLRVTEREGVSAQLITAHGGRLDGSALRIKPDQEAELFFRLLAPTEGRVRVEFFHPGSLALAPISPDERFTVHTHLSIGVPPQENNPATHWTDSFSDGPERAVFEHLQVHGSITEDELARLLGSPRAARRFANQLETWQRRLPFGVHSDSVNGVKRYVREEV